MALSLPHHPQCPVLTIGALSVASGFAGDASLQFFLTDPSYNCISTALADPVAVAAGIQVNINCLYCCYVYLHYNRGYTPTPVRVAGPEVTYPPAVGPAAGPLTPACVTHSNGHSGTPHAQIRVNIPPPANFNAAKQSPVASGHTYGAYHANAAVGVRQPLRLGLLAHIRVESIAIDAIRDRELECISLTYLQAALLELYRQFHLHNPLPIQTKLHSTAQNRASLRGTLQQLDDQGKGKPILVAAAPSSPSSSSSSSASAATATSTAAFQTPIKTETANTTTTAAAMTASESFPVNMSRSDDGSIDFEFAAAVPASSPTLASVTGDPATAELETAIVKLNFHEK